MHKRRVVRVNDRELLCIEIDNVDRLELVRCILDAQQIAFAGENKVHWLWSGACQCCIDCSFEWSVFGRRSLMRRENASDDYGSRGQNSRHD